MQNVLLSVQLAYGRVTGSAPIIVSHFCHDVLLVLVCESVLGWHS